MADLAPEPESKGGRLPLEHELTIRVRYHETDGQGRVHHAQYLNYFERGRVELLRSLGHSYRDLEATGLMLVVAEMNVRYLGAAVFDDLLRLTTRVVQAKGARLTHQYWLTRYGDDTSDSQESPDRLEREPRIVEAHSVIAAVDRQGRVRRLPEYLRQ